jgi:hypothetical protein
MINKDKLRQRFLHDPLPTRLGNLSATLGRISSNARRADNPAIISGLLDEAKHLIEWTAADASLETAAELVEMQRLIALWQRAWSSAAQDRSQAILLSAQAKSWADKALDLSGLAG